MIAAGSPECAAAMSPSSEAHARTVSGVAEAATGGTGRTYVAGQQAREGGVHPVHGITDSHRRERIAVVPAADAQEPLLLWVP